MQKILVFTLCSGFINLIFCIKRYDPSWASLDEHVAPSWYDEGKIGIFMHWGLYSVPSFGTPTAGSEWLWRRWTCKLHRLTRFNFVGNF